MNSFIVSMILNGTKINEEQIIMSIWARMNNLNSSTYHVNQITFVTHDFIIISTFYKVVLKTQSTS